MHIKRGSFIDKFWSLLFPDRCPYCGEIIFNGVIKCDKCEKSINYDFKITNVLDDVICVSPFSYEGKVREAILNFKFKGYREYDWNFAKDMVKSIKKKFPNMDFSCVTYVPSFWKMNRDREYNQSKRLAYQMGDILNLPVIRLLRKVKDNYPQHKIKTAIDRIRNVRGVYKATVECSNQNDKIILCDDIITSGSTLRECVKMLKDAGFNDILCATIAYTKEPG